MGYLANKLTDVNDLGFFATSTALAAAYPVGAVGYFAIVGETDSIWIWDTDTSAWVDSGGGTGTGDVNGPASAVDGNFASFDTTTGKLIKDSGKKASDFADALTSDQNYVTDAQLTVIGNTSGTNTGDSATNTTSNSYADGKVAQTITNGVTTSAPSQDAVFDALAGKQPVGTYSTDIHSNITALNLVSGTNTGDQTGGTPAIVLGTANTAGSSPNFLRRDDTILAFDVTSPSTQAYGDSAVVGVATVAARRDHKHAMPASTKDTTAITGILKGNGTSVSAATVRTDYAESTTALATGILKNTTTTGAHTIATGADLPTMTATIGGAVPTPPNNTTTFLRGDGTFATPDIKYVTRVISSAEILDLYNTPIEIIPAPGANKMIRIIGGNLYNKFNTTAYASGGTSIFYFGTTSTPAAAASVSTSFLQATSSAIAGVVANTTVYVANIVDLPITLKMITQNPTTGDGTFIVSVAYITIDI